MIKTILNFLREDDGASAVEYGLLVGLIAVVLIAVLGTLGTDLSGLFQTVATKLSQVGGTGG